MVNPPVVSAGPVVQPASSPPSVLVPAISLGRIVLFRLPHAPATGGESEQLAAIVTKVHIDGSVNLHVFSSQSGTYFPQRVTEGDKPGQWSWPPRV